MIDENSINRLISFVHNLEDKLLSINLIYNNLYELMSILSQTQQTIFDDLKNIKTILNQTNIQQEEDELVTIFYFFLSFIIIKE